MTSSESPEPIYSELAAKAPAYIQIIEEFIQGLDQRIDALHEALACRDFECLRRLAHQLKGSAGGYGYPQITEQADILERHCLTSQTEHIAADVRCLVMLLGRARLLPESATATHRAP